MNPIKKLHGFIEDLPPEEQAVLADNLPAFKHFIMRLAIVAGCTFSYFLDFTRGHIIARLLEQGGPWGYINPRITDEQFPVKGDGKRRVRYRGIKGADIKRRADGLVYRVDVEAAFCKEGVRFGNAAENLLVLAEDSEAGCGDEPIAMFVEGSSFAFLVREGVDGTRDLDLNGNVSLLPRYIYIGVVCE